MQEITTRPSADFIFSLCGEMSVSGFESRGADAIRARFADAFDSIETDAVGNHILVRRCGREGAPRILIDAHFDEIGFLVTEVLERGFVRLAPLGGIDPSIMQGADVVLYGKETLRGVIASVPPHLRSTDEKGALPAVEDMTVDTGFSVSAEELSKTVPVGTPVGFAPCYTVLSGGEEGARSLAGKSFDNKACGAAALFAVMNTPREAMAGDVYVLLSSYEETSRLGGVSAATYRVRPDYAMVIDVNLARVPDTKKYDTVPFGKGVSLSWSAATDRRLTRMTRELCEREEIPFCTVAAPTSTGTNATTVNLVADGVPVVDVGLPLKNMHTYNEIISEKDVEALCRLVECFVCAREPAEAFGKEGA